MGSSEPALQMAGVVRTFGDVTALDGLELSVAGGEVVGLLGHNGAGKTTAVRTLAGLLPPDRGTARVRGLDPFTRGADVRRSVGVLPARPVVDGRLTAVQNLRFAADTFGVPRDGLDERILETLATSGLADRAHERVAGFSTGMRQRLSLARVLLPDPPVLLLDEPTGTLDPVAARQVRELLAALARERDRTLVLATHDLNEAELLCDRVVVLEHGRVVAEGSPSELAARHGTAGVRVDFGAGDVDRALALLGADDDLAATPTGPGLVTVRPVPRDRVPELLARLAAAGLTVYEARRLEPTLEDVYLALHGHGGRRAGTEGTP